MKKIKVILLAFCAMASIVPAAAQDAEVDLPFFPYRDTNHVRTMRIYRVDTLTGERKLQQTNHYDRHGFMYDSLDVLVYDSKGRLTECVHRVLRKTPRGPKPQVEVSRRFSVDYDADGTVRRVRRVDDGNPDSVYTTYERISYKRHPRFGLTDYTFLITCSIWDDYVDTAFFRREYDEKGHLLREASRKDADDGDGYYDVQYYYDASGRRIAERGYYYESADTLNYHYDERGVLTGMTGIIYDLDIEVEVEISYRPDGTHSEMWQRWHPYVVDPENPMNDKLSEDYDVAYTRFDSHGMAVYQKYPGWGVTEWEIEYWE